VPPYSFSSPAVSLSGSERPDALAATLQRLPCYKARLVVIRRETLEDRPAVDAVTSAAFGPPGSGQPPPETVLIRALRRDAGWIEKLSLVAVRDARIVGHVVCTRGWVGEVAALGLGPISVLPTYQRQGTGHALMHAIIAAAEAVGEPLIALLGDPHFYRRFGFVEASRLGVAAPHPGWGSHFQVRTLTDFRSSVTGMFRYAAPFADL
jgi:putative acetyltransferase